MSVESETFIKSIYGLDVAVRRYQIMVAEMLSQRRVEEQDEFHVADENNQENNGILKNSFNDIDVIERREEVKTEFHIPTDQFVGLEI